MTLKDFLLSEAAKTGHPSDDDFCPEIVRYAEHIVPEAINGDEWLEKQTSYIWKVGVLSIVDGNKRDFGRLYIGHERQPGCFDYIGCLYWGDGENDDPGRCLQRAVNLARQVDCMFY